MKQEEYRQLEFEQNGLEVVLKFPKESENDKNIKKEVREMLFHILEEYLAKNSYSSLY